MRPRYSIGGPLILIAVGVLFLVEGTTDNKNRTVAELRKIFEKAGGLLGASGTAAWAFDKKGQIQLEKSAATEDQLMEIAVGAGLLCARQP